MTGRHAADEPVVVGPPPPSEEPQGGAHVADRPTDAPPVVTTSGDPVDDTVALEVVRLTDPRDAERPAGGAVAEGAEAPATAGAPATAATAEARSGADSGVLGSSAVMAAGTVLSRFSGYFRNILLVAAIGNAVHADVFNVANTIPNALYILLAGGIFNAVLVPQLVRALKNDADGGAAYIDRIVTLAALFLGVVTVLLVVFAPAVMTLYLDADFRSPELAAQRESAIAFARYCLPQVFFYGMFVLLGQILNSRGRFGPMMWAPIANNLLAIAMLAVYLWVFGPVARADINGAYSGAQELVLGVGSTLGIVAQLLILVPYLRSAGVRYRPRFDFRGTGLGRTFRLAGWTIGFVVVNQVAWTVATRLATGGGLGGGDGEAAAGQTVYSNVMLIMMAPHAIVTVSLATAVLPRLSASAADGDRRRLGGDLAGTLRTSLALMVPVVALVAVLARDLAGVIWAYGGAADTYELFAPALALFAPAMVFFTVHYLMLRGFYALEATRTVFWVQCVIAGANVALALLLVRTVDRSDTVPALVVAYGLAYALGATVSYSVLSRRVGGLQTPRFAAFWARLLPLVLLAAAAALGVRLLVGDLLDPVGPVPLRAGLSALPSVVVFGVLYLLGARLLRLREVTEVLGAVTGRLRRR